MVLNERGSKKSVEELYSAIFAIREALQDASQLAAEAAVIAEAFGGEISRVITAQLNQYFIPAISKYIDDEKTPGAMSPLVTFLDSVPLAMTRQEPEPEQTTPAPIKAELAAPPTAAPAEGSYAAQKAAPVAESRKRESAYDAFMSLKAKGVSPKQAARKAVAAAQEKDPDYSIYDLANELDGEYELEDLLESAKRVKESAELDMSNPDQWFVVAANRGKEMPFRIRGGEAFRIAPWGNEDDGMTTVVVDPDDEIEVSISDLEAAYSNGVFAPEGGNFKESHFSALDAELSGADQPDDDFDDEFSAEDLTDDEDDLLFTDASNMNESASETYGVFRNVGKMTDDRVFTGTKEEADAFAKDRNSKLDRTEIDDQGIKYEVRKCQKPEGKKDVSKPGELPKVKEYSQKKVWAGFDRILDYAKSHKISLRDAINDLEDEDMDAPYDDDYNTAAVLMRNKLKSSGKPSTVLDSWATARGLSDDSFYGITESVVKPRRVEESHMSELDADISDMDIDELAQYIADESRDSFARLEALKVYDELMNNGGASYTEEDLDAFVDAFRDIEAEKHINDDDTPVEIQDALDYESNKGDEDLADIFESMRPAKDPLTEALKGRSLAFEAQRGRMKEAFGPMAGPQVGSLPRKDDDTIDDLRDEYFAGTDPVFDNDDDYMEESLKTDRWNREAAASQAHENDNLVAAARKLEQLLDAGYGSMEAWDKVIQEYPDVDEDELASRL